MSRAATILERLSSVLLHSTTLYQAIGVFKSNQFILSRNDLQRSDDDPQLPQTMQRLDTHRYAMSFARTADSRFIKSIGDVIYLIDGDKLNNLYSGRAVNFFGSRFELEDRLLTNQPIIPHAIDYIKEIHLSLKDEFIYNSSYSWKYKDQVEELWKLAHSHGKPLYAYFNRKDYLARNKSKAVSQAEIAAISSKRDTNGTYGALDALNQLNQKKPLKNRIWTIRAAGASFPPQSLQMLRSKP